MTHPRGQREKKASLGLLSSPNQALCQLSELLVFDFEDEAVIQPAVLFRELCYLEFKTIIIDILLRSDQVSRMRSGI